MSRNDLIGLDEIIKTLQQVDKIATRSITKAAKAGAQIVLTNARINAPVDTSNLKKGIKLKLEKSKEKVKKVYQIGFFGKSGKGEEFVKISKDGKRSFYPVSQEYGWIDADGTKHQGKRFLRDALDNNRIQVTEKTLTTLANEIDKVR